MAKASSPWSGAKSERLQVSMCLPNDRDLDTWYEAVYALPIAWPDVTDIGAHYFKKTSANQLLALRAHLGGLICGGRSRPNGTYSAIIWNRGPNYLNAQQLEELLTLNRPNRPGDDVKDNVLPYSYKKEWWEWERAKDEIKNRGSGAAPLSFVDENEAVNHILQVVRRDEIAIGITYNQSKEIDSHKDDRAIKRRRKEDSQGNAPHSTVHFSLA